MQKMLGDEGFAKYLKAVAETVLNSETVISRYVPELSNAPAAIVASGARFLGAESRNVDECQGEHQVPCGQRSRENQDERQKQIAKGKIKARKSSPTFCD